MPGWDDGVLEPLGLIPGVGWGGVLKPLGSCLGRDDGVLESLGLIPGVG